MTALEMLIDVLSRSRERFDRAFDGVTLEQANTRPAPDLAPHIDSLTWLACTRPASSTSRSQPFPQLSNREQTRPTPLLDAIS